MNDIRRTILMVIFGFSLILLWDQWQVANGNKATFMPSSQPAVVAPVVGASGMPGAATTSATATGSVPVQGAVAAPVNEKIQITTDLFKARIDSQGGTLSNLELLKFASDTDPQRGVLLMDDDAPATRYVAQTGLLNKADAGDKFPNHLTLMTPLAGPRELAPGQDTLEVQFESPASGGLKYVKTYQFKRGDYAIHVKHQVVNVSDQPRDGAQLYLQLLRHGTVKAGSMFGTSTYTGPATYTADKKFHKIDFTDIEKNKAEMPAPANNGWVAMIQHYFVSAWLLNGPDGATAQREFRVANLGNNLYTVAMVLPLEKIAPGATQTIDSTLYAGPEEERKLEALAPGLELVKDYGIFTIIAKPLYWLLSKLHGLIGNWGWSIVALVVLLKAVFYPLNAKAYGSMAKMKSISPKITAMRERLKDKPQQEMQQEMMRIYKEEKVNPMGGCVPIVIPIPVFMGLDWVLLSSVEMRNAPWILWIHDLSTPDPWFILPIVMTATSMVQTWLNPTPPDPMQAKLMWIMPLVFSVMFFFFPAGLVMYWITNNVLSITQQWFINKRLGVLGNLPKLNA